MRLALSARLVAALSLGGLPAIGQEKDKPVKDKPAKDKPDKDKKDKDKKEPDKPKPEDPSKAGPDYYPLKEGATWTYQVTGAKVGDTAKASEKEFTVKVIGVDKEGVAKLETKEKDKLIATEEVQVKKGEVLRVGFAGSKAEPPLCFLKPGVKDGEKWPFSSKIAGQEVKGEFTRGSAAKVKVGGKEYDTLTATSSEITIENQKVKITYWFAKGVGMVKQLVDVGGKTVTIELKKYDEPKK